METFLTILVTLIGTILIFIVGFCFYLLFTFGSFVLSILLWILNKAFIGIIIAIILVIVIKEIISSFI